MKEPDNIKLNFGTPEHGWLPVEFKHNEFELNFDASDVPKIPTDLLCECLISVMKGLEAKMYWFLEPGYYLFDFLPNGGEIDLLISASDESIVNQKKVHKISGNHDCIILPMYRCLKKFSTTKIENFDWKKIDEDNLAELTELVNKRKTAYNR